jgi:predicted CopG family antitoxin
LTKLLYVVHTNKKETTMSEYQQLAQHLSAITTETWPASFSDIERIIGRRLPPSAYQHRPWWSNNTANSAMTRIWVAAGWKSEQVDMAGQRLVFRRVREKSTAPAPFNYHITVSAEANAHLAQRAKRTGQEVAEVIAELIEQNAKPKLSERLKVATNILKSGPTLHDLDVVEMIREERQQR